jgi:hypothetical protein
MLECSSCIEKNCTQVMIPDPLRYITEDLEDELTNGRLFDNGLYVWLPNDAVIYRLE